jgi:hypothetical protein
MKSPYELLALALITGLSSCTSVTKSPIPPPPAVMQPGTVKPRPKPPVKEEPVGALKPVSAPKPQPKPFPDIPLKEETGVSPLIHSKPDTPTYQRSGS